MAQHPYKAILDAWTADTSIEIEKAVGLYWVPLSHPAAAITGLSGEFRIKPKMRSVTVDGVKYEWPEPVRVAPEIGTKFWFAASMQTWAATRSNDTSDYKILKAGFMQATLEGAEAHRRALIAVSGGEL